MTTDMMRLVATFWPFESLAMARFLSFTVPLKLTFDERTIDEVRRAADVERTHRQLRARLTDRLRGDDADSLADVDRRTASEVAAVALGANAVDRLAGQHRADADFLDLGLGDGFGLASPRSGRRWRR